MTNAPEDTYLQQTKPTTQPLQDLLGHGHTGLDVIQQSMNHRFANPPNKTLLRRKVGSK